MFDLSFELGIPVHEILQTFSMNELLLYEVYVADRLWTARRNDYNQAGVMATTANLAFAFGAKGRQKNRDDCLMRWGPEVKMQTAEAMTAFEKAVRPMLQAKQRAMKQQKG